MKVKAVWEFEADVEDLDGEFVDKGGLAKDLTRLELAVLLDKHDISADDFKYVVEK